MDSFFEPNSQQNFTSFLSNLTITGNQQIDRYVIFQTGLQLTSVFTSFLGYGFVIIPFIFKLPFYLPNLIMWIVTKNYIITEIEYGIKLYSIITSYLKLIHKKEKTKLRNTLYLLNSNNTFDWIDNFYYILKKNKTEFLEKHSESQAVDCYIKKNIKFENKTITIEYDVNSLSHEYRSYKPIYIYFNWWFCDKDYIIRFIKFLKYETQSNDNTDKDGQLKIKYAKVLKNDDYIEYSKKNISKRSLDSVYLNKETKIKLLEDIQKFKLMEPFYKSHSISYKRGYLLYGPPGTGKTSIIKAIASHFDYSIIIINLNQFNDDNINQLFADMDDDDKTKIYLFDDFDSCMLFDETKTSNVIIKADSKDIKSKLSYSGFINALSGINDCVNGSFMFFTTNNLEKIPQNMLRPGRVDMVLEIGYATTNQFEEMVNDFYKNCDGIKTEILIDKLKKTDKKLTIAIIQDYFIRFRDIDDAISNIGELF